MSMAITVVVGYERAAKSDTPDTITGEFTITNWDDLVKIEGGCLDVPVYIDRVELLRALLALQAGA